MAIETKIICDSIGPNGVRITTFVLTFPRFVLPEFNTHRMFSRNGASSRAIPVSKQIEKIISTPFVPKAFNKNAQGMQGAEIVSVDIQSQAESIWLKARDEAIVAASKLAELGIAKQYANRLLEPFSFTTMVVTATEFANFFALRHHSMAQPELAEVARQMYELYSTNKPEELKEGDWHLPFITEDDKQQQALISIAGKEELSEKEVYDTYWLPLIKRSVARCARVSYLNHAGKDTTYEQDCALYDRLLGSQPIHASPAEHQAKCLSWVDDLWYGNFHGWEQFRKTLENENITEFTGPLG